VLQTIDEETISELLRIKKPQPHLVIIGQLYCILLWLFQVPAGDLLNESKYSYDAVEAEFSDWHNIHHFLSINEA